MGRLELGTGRFRQLRWLLLVGTSGNGPHQRPNPNTGRTSASCEVQLAAESSSRACGFLRFGNVNASQDQAELLSPALPQG